MEFLQGKCFRNLASKVTPFELNGVLPLRSDHDSHLQSHLFRLFRRQDTARGFRESFQDRRDVRSSRKDKQGSQQESPREDFSRSFLSVLPWICLLIFFSSFVFADGSRPRLIVIALSGGGRGGPWTAAGPRLDEEEDFGSSPLPLIKPFYLFSLLFKPSIRHGCPEKREPFPEVGGEQEISCLCEATW